MQLRPQSYEKILSDVSMPIFFLVKTGIQSAKKDGDAEIEAGKKLLRNEEIMSHFLFLGFNNWCYVHCASPLLLCFPCLIILHNRIQI